MRSLKVNWREGTMVRSMNGLVVSAAEISAVVLLIAECTSVRKVAILRMHIPLIARGRRMSFLTVLAGRLL
jgi:hypothetical protein